MTTSDFTFAQNKRAKAPEEVHVRMVSYQRWDALKSQVGRLGERTTSFSSAAWAFVGIAAGAFTSLLSWWPAFAAMTPDLRAAFGWVWVVLVSVAVLGAGAAIVAFLADRTIQGGRAISIESVLEEMARLEEE